MVSCYFSSFYPGIMACRVQWSFSCRQPVAGGKHLTSSLWKYECCANSVVLLASLALIPIQSVVISVVLLASLALDSYGSVAISEVLLASLTQFLWNCCRFSSFAVTFDTKFI
jgi:hypothetical protein